MEILVRPGRPNLIWSQVVDHPNAHLITRAYDAFGRGDILTVLGILSDDIHWHVPGQSPLSGDSNGHDGCWFFSTSVQSCPSTATVVGRTGISFSTERWPASAPRCNAQLAFGRASFLIPLTDVVLVRAAEAALAVHASSGTAMKAAPA